ncbi:NADH dehydrogenase [ubiquinone] 1 alpha subcomplex assembly factor 4 isoform X2 [Syngnathoides biaculeatus]|uniref:NADH dehydrogenase [ubiquinone] 1 alpha subcomplex assembly factor 4 isoform X2 n=1 Tax=Syngnathoides biaculeatus TaxID=300417 RepID=UPI002ADDB09C|nr:NADH dehydrogenase [ubiquinone] 1 alpha subcomplex assembly factor 4 isoform X2 [Syngnathoides biaculeatus]
MMGARLVRLVRNVNLENRIQREISKDKPRSAPRHKLTQPTSTAQNEAISFSAESVTGAVHQKNDPLLCNLKSVFVESKDKASLKEECVDEDTKTRPVKFTLPGDSHGLATLTSIPHGKLTITEALKALSSHHSQPHTWTSQRISEEYCLNLKETNSFLAFFIPFQIQIIPPQIGNVKKN